MELNPKNPFTTQQCVFVTKLAQDARVEQRRAQSKPQTNPNPCPVLHNIPHEFHPKNNKADKFEARDSFT